MCQSLLFTGGRVRLSPCDLNKCPLAGSSDTGPSDSLGPKGLQPTRLLCPWNSPGKNTEVGSHSLLQGIFTTQRSNLGLLHCRQILYCLSHQGNPSSKPNYGLLRFWASHELSWHLGHSDHSTEIYSEEARKGTNRKHSFFSPLEAVQPENKINFW